MSLSYYLGRKCQLSMCSSTLSPSSSHRTTPLPSIRTASVIVPDDAPLYGYVRLRHPVTNTIIGSLARISNTVTGNGNTWVRGVSVPSAFGGGTTDCGAGWQDAQLLVRVCRDATTGRLRMTHSVRGNPSIVTEYLLLTNLCQVHGPLEVLVNNLNVTRWEIWIQRTAVVGY